MTILTALFIFVLAAFACYLVWQWQQATPAPEPYPMPVTCNQDCRQGRDCDCFQRSCDMSVAEFDGTKLNPKATWPFPHGAKP